MILSVWLCQTAKLSLTTLAGEHHFLPSAAQKPLRKIESKRRCYQSLIVCGGLQSSTTEANGYF